MRIPPFPPAHGSGVRILRRPADGTGTAEVVAPVPAGYPEIVLPGAKALIYHPVERIAMLLPIDPKTPARPLLPDIKGQVSDVELSPDGRWIAYESNESGRFEVYVRPYPDVNSGRWQRFLFIKHQTTERPTITVVANWIDEVRAKVTRKD